MRFHSRFVIEEVILAANWVSPSRHTHGLQARIGVLALSGVVPDDDPVAEEPIHHGRRHYGIEQTTVTRRAADRG